jgi:hypothetical protein
MAFDRQAGGHAFLPGGPCAKCRMTREEYDNHPTPCTGRPAAPRQDDKFDFVPDDPLEGDR